MVPLDVMDAEIRLEAKRADVLSRELADTVAHASSLRATNRTVRRQVGQRTRRVRRQLDTCSGEVDRFTAVRTLPPAMASGSGTGTVDPAVWLLHVRFARTRAAADRDALVDEYRNYALALARRFRRDREPSEDLAQVAMEALLVAIDRFDPTRRLPFPAFATPTIAGALKRHYRDAGWAVRVPRRIHEIAGPARDAGDRLTLELGRSPTVSEVAGAIGVTEEELLEANDATHARAVTSLDAPVGPDSTRFDLIGNVDPAIGQTENRLALRQALLELDDQDRDLLRLYFFEELSQTEIAARYDVSQMQVSRWISSAIKRLRTRVPAG